MRAIFICLFALSVTVAHADERALAREHIGKNTRPSTSASTRTRSRNTCSRTRPRTIRPCSTTSGRRTGSPGTRGRGCASSRLPTKLPRAENRDDVEHKIAELEKTTEHEDKARNELPPDQVIKPAPPMVDAGAESAARAGAGRRASGSAGQRRQAAPGPARASPEDRRGGDRRGWRSGGQRRRGDGAARGQTSDELSRSSSFDPGKLDAFHRYQALEAAFLGVGAAAVIGGAGELRRRWRRSQLARLTLAPMAARTGGRVTFQGVLTMRS